MIKGEFTALCQIDGRKRSLLVCWSREETRGPGSRRTLETVMRFTLDGQPFEGRKLEPEDLERIQFDIDQEYGAAVPGGSEVVGRGSGKKGVSNV